VLQKTVKYAREGTLIPKAINKFKKSIGIGFDNKRIRDEIEYVLKYPENEAIRAIEKII
jgi:hypothetical protein